MGCINWSQEWYKPGRLSPEELAERAVDVARSAGASYADARYLAEEWESIDVQDDRAEGVDDARLRAGEGVVQLVFLDRRLQRQDAGDPALQSVALHDRSRAPDVR